MAGSDVYTDALATWLAQGATSETHPVLRFAFDTFLRPLGVEADALEAEPFSGFEAGSNEWWLWNSRWNPAGFDRSHAAAVDFGHALDAPPAIQVEVSSRGCLAFRRTDPADLAAAAFFEASQNSWLARRHSIRASHEVEIFLSAAAGMLLVDHSFASLYLAGDAGEYCAAVRRSLF